MKNLFKTLEYYWDYYNSYYLYHAMDSDKYFDFMAAKWGDRWYSHMEKLYQDYLER